MQQVAQWATWVMGTVAFVSAMYVGLDRGKYTKLESTVEAQSVLIDTLSQQQQASDRTIAAQTREINELHRTVAKLEGIIDGKKEAMVDMVEAVAASGVCSKAFSCDARGIPGASKEE